MVMTSINDLALGFENQGHQKTLLSLQFLTHIVVVFCWLLENFDLFRCLITPDQQRR